MKENKSPFEGFEEWYAEDDTDPASDLPEIVDIVRVIVDTTGVDDHFGPIISEQRFLVNGRGFERWRIAREIDARGNDDLDEFCTFIRHLDYNWHKLFTGWCHGHGVNAYQACRDNRIMAVLWVKFRNWCKSSNLNPWTCGNPIIDPKSGDLRFECYDDLDPVTEK